MSAQMTMRGIEQRAQDARGALQRLRFEIEFYDPEKRPLELSYARLPLAELMGIMANIVTLLDTRVTTEDREAMGALFAWYSEYHKTAR